jgi:hypothetical protein
MDATRVLVALGTHPWPQYQDALKATWQWSPQIRSFPEPLTMMSAKLPPITTLSPLPTLMTSGPARHAALYTTVTGCNESHSYPGQFTGFKKNYVSGAM